MIHAEEAQEILKKISPELQKLQDHITEYLETKTQSIEADLKNDIKILATFTKEIESYLEKTKEPHANFYYVDRGW